MIEYIQPSNSFSQAQVNWFNALRNWIVDNHIIVGAPVTPALATPITTLSSRFQSNRDGRVSQAVAGTNIGADLTTYLTTQMMVDMTASNPGWTFVLTPSAFLNLTSSTKEGMFDIFSLWLTTCGLAATNSGGITFPCVFQRV